MLYTISPSLALIKDNFEFSMDILTGGKDREISDGMFLWGFLSGVSMSWYSTYQEQNELFKNIDSEIKIAIENNTLETQELFPIFNDALKDKFNFEELLNDKKITKKEFIDNIYDVQNYLLKLVDKKVIKKKDYDEHLLLSFKFGAVSMAKKTDAYLVPYGITGEYKFRSKDLKVKIGKPIKVGDDLEKSNKELRDTIAELMRESLKK